MIGNKSRGFLDGFRGSSNSLGNNRSRVSDVDGEAELLRFSDDEGQASPCVQHLRQDSSGAGRPVGLLSAAYNNEPLPDVERKVVATMSGKDIQVTTKPWQPSTATKRSTFDQYGTFPDLLGLDDDTPAEQHDNDNGAVQRDALLQQPNETQQQRVADPHFDTIPLYVIPLFKHQLVVIPLPRDPPKKDQNQPDWVGQVVQTGQTVQKKAAETWESLKHSKPDSLQHKMYRAGQAQLENLSPEQRLLGGIPDYARKLMIIHSPDVDAEDVLRYMSETIQKLGTDQRVKQIGAATLLPFTFMLDSIVLPGPAILTGITGYKCYHYSKAAAGSVRLKKFVDREEGIVESAEMSADDIEFVADERIAKYNAAARDEEGVLLESVIHELAEELGAPELEDVAQQLRRQYLRSKGKLPVYDSNMG